jgi:hypothetical protein
MLDRVDLGGMTEYSTSKLEAAHRIRILVDGRTPLLTHNPQSMGINKDAAKGSRIPEADDEAEAGCYRNEEGNLCLRGEAFRASMLKAAGAWKMKKSTTAKSLLAHVVVLEELVPLFRRDGTLITDYVIDARRAIVQKAGIIRHRPKFMEWSCLFTMEFDEMLVPKPTLIPDILQDAGNRVGVGDYRPSCNGWFGRYGVRTYKLLDSE